MKKLALTFLAAACAALPARASFVCVAPTSSTTGLLTITAPINFTITTAGSVFLFRHHQLGHHGRLAHRREPPPRSAYSLNGASFNAASYFVDNLATGQFGTVVPNDGYLSINNAVAVHVGDTFSLLAGSYHPAPPSPTSTRNARRASTATSSWSEKAARPLPRRPRPEPSPEPSTWAMMGVGVAGLGVVTLRRRRAVRLA